MDPEEEIRFSNRPHRVDDDFRTIRLALDRAATYLPLLTENNFEFTLAEPKELIQSAIDHVVEAKRALLEARSIACRERDQMWEQLTAGPPGADSRDEPADQR